MKTFSAKAEDTTRKWWVIDAKDRVLGDAVALPDAVAVEPTLEDGYIWLMRNRETAGQAS